MEVCLSSETIHVMFTSYEGCLYLLIEQINSGAPMFRMGPSKYEGSVYQAVVIGSDLIDLLNAVKIPTDCPDFVSFYSE